MAATWSIRVIKEFTYRGAVRKFSNRYHIGTNGPPDSTHWTTFSDAIVTAEKAIYTPFANAGARIVGTVGYSAGSEIPVFNKTYSTTGTGAFSAYMTTPGDVAALVRYSTPDRSTKNHPIYCFNYYHAMGTDSGGLTPDVINPAQKTALGTYATAWITGFSDGTTTFHRSRPTGNLVTGSLVEPYLTHRDLPR